MKKTLAALLGLVFLGSVGHAQHIPGQEELVIASAYDVDSPTEVADDNQVVTVVNLTNAALTIAAQLDVPRNVTCTIVDTGASITAGTTTIVGTGLDDEALTEVLDGSGGAGVLTGAQYFKTITSITNAAYAVLDGAGDETIICGSGSLVAYTFPGFEGKNNRRDGAPMPVSAPIENASLSTTISAVNPTEIVTAVNLTNTTLTLADATPEDAGPVYATIVDTTDTLTAGNITITGTSSDSNQGIITEVIAFEGCGGGCILQGTQEWETINSIVTAGWTALDGGGDETIVINAGERPFELLSALDLLFITNNDTGEEFIRQVITKTSNISIVLDRAIDLSASEENRFSWKNYVVDYADLGGLYGVEQGWFSVRGMWYLNFSISIAQSTATDGVSYMVQCRNENSTKYVVNAVGPTNVATTVTSFTSNVVVEPWGECRVGLIIGDGSTATNTDDASDAVVEVVSVELTARR